MHRLNRQRHQRPKLRLSELIHDPLEFDRAAQVPRISMAITAFFQRSLAHSVR
jgi:hypothetical protein